MLGGVTLDLVFKSFSFAKKKSIYLLQLLPHYLPFRENIVPSGEKIPSRILISSLFHPLCSSVISMGLIMQRNLQNFIPLHFTDLPAAT